MHVRGKVHPLILVGILSCVMLVVPRPPPDQGSTDAASRRTDAAAVTTMPPASAATGAQIVACTATLEPKSVDGTDRASAFIEHAQGNRSLGNKARTEADYRAAIASGRDGDWAIWCGDRT